MQLALQHLGQHVALHAAQGRVTPDPKANGVAQRQLVGAFLDGFSPPLFCLERSPLVAFRHDDLMLAGVLFCLGDLLVGHVLEAVSRAHAAPGEAEALGAAEQGRAGDGGRRALVGVTHLLPHALASELLVVQGVLA